MDRSKSLESVQWNAEPFKGLYLILVFEDHPEVACQIQDFWRVAEQELLIPMRVSCGVH